MSAFAPLSGDKLTNFPDSGRARQNICEVLVVDAVRPARGRPGGPSAAFAVKVHLGIQEPRNSGSTGARRGGWLMPCRTLSLTEPTRVSADRIDQ